VPLPLPCLPGRVLAVYRRALRPALWDVRVTVYRCAADSAAVERPYVAAGLVNLVLCRFCCGSLFVRYVVALRTRVPFAVVAPYLLLLDGSSCGGVGWLIALLQCRTRFNVFLPFAGCVHLPRLHTACRCVAVRSLFADTVCRVPYHLVGSQHYCLCLTAVLLCPGAIALPTLCRYYAVAFACTGFRCRITGRVLPLSGAFVACRVLHTLLFMRRYRCRYRYLVCVCCHLLSGWFSLAVAPAGYAIYLVLFLLPPRGCCAACLPTPLYACMQRVPDGLNAGRTTPFWFLYTTQPLLRFTVLLLVFAFVANVF